MLLSKRKSITWWFNLMAPTTRANWAPMLFWVSPLLLLRPELLTRVFLFTGKQIQLVTQLTSPSKWKFIPKNSNNTPFISFTRVNSIDRVLICTIIKRNWVKLPLQKWAWKNQKLQTNLIIPNQCWSIIRLLYNNAINIIDTSLNWLARRTWSSLSLLSTLSTVVLTPVSIIIR